MDLVTGASAWHKELEMSSQELDEFLSGRWIARVATNGRGGYPHVAPLWYYWDGECIYLSLTTSRQSFRNLVRDPRCCVLVDMDDRPLMGPRKNLAKAVFIRGDAELTSLASDQLVRIGAGPWQGQHPVGKVLTMIVSRYGFWSRDGALGLTSDVLAALIGKEEYQDSQLAKDNRGRVLVKVAPTSLKTWDFSKASFSFPCDGDRG